MGKLPIGRSCAGVGLALISAFGSACESTTAIPPPEITSVEPNQISPAVDSQISVHGRHFYANMRMSFNDDEPIAVSSSFAVELAHESDTTALSHVVLRGSTELGAQVPTGAPVGLHDVVIVDPMGRTATLLNALEILPDAVWWNLSWNCRYAFSLDNSGQSDALVSFPVLVILSPAMFDYSKAGPGGTDLRFVDEGDVELRHHIEQWDPLGTSYIWVRVPLIAAASSNDLIWMYYGNPSAGDVQDESGTYDDAFVGVWHLSESAGSSYDSTSHNNHGTAQSGVEQNVVGKVGGGARFDGVDDYVIVNHDATLNLVDAWTIETWVNVDEFLFFDWQALVSKDVNGILTTRPASLWLWDSWVEIWFWPDRDALRSNQRLTAGIWHHLAATFSAGELRLYIDGDLDNSAFTSVPVTADYDLHFGQRGENTSSNYWFDGALDEVRISNVARSPSWIGAQVLSMTGDFVRAGGELCQ